MGLSSLGNKEYGKIITIVKGSFTQRLRDGEEAPKGTREETRVLEKGQNAGTEVREARADALENNIIESAEFVENMFGTNFILHMIDESEERFDLQLPIESQFYKQFVKRIDNLDMSKTVTFVLGKETKGENSRSFMYLLQDGQSVKMAHTKDNPNGMPPPEQKEVRGKVTWDWSAQEEWLDKKAEEFVTVLRDGTEPPVVKEVEEEIPF